MITVTAPMRLSLAGGGTDLPQWYARRPASLLSLAVSIRMTVTVSEAGGHDASTLTDLFERRNPGTAVRVAADCSPGAGLGGSGALAVCLVAAEHLLHGRTVTPQVIAAEAYRWEHDELGEPVGFQDQFAAAFGGAVLMSAGPDRSPRAHVDPGLTDDLEWLVDHAFVVAETPLRRSAGELLTALSKSDLFKDGARNRPASVEEMTHAVRARDGVAVGELLRRHWEAKKANLPESSSDYIDRSVAAALAAGATGAKVMGAGRGGFILAAGPPEKREAVEAALEQSGCRTHRVAVDRQGVRAKTVSTVEERC